MFRLPIFGRRIERKGVGGDGGGDEYDIRLEMMVDKEDIDGEFYAP